MRHLEFNPQTIAEYLQGTCGTLADAVESHYEGMTEDDLTSEDFDAIDNIVFLCEECGWWCEVSEYSDIDDSEKCRDCAGDE